MVKGILDIIKAHMNIKMERYILKNMIDIEDKFLKVNISMEKIKAN